MRVFLLLATALLMTALAADETVKKDLSNQEINLLKNITDGELKFGMDLFSTLYEDNKEKNNSLVFSPLSVDLALALLYPAAKGHTSELLVRALHLPSETDKVYKGFKNLLALIKNPSLRIANRIFVEDTFPVKQAYKKDLKSHFDADAQTVSFSKETDKSIGVINKWVEEATAKLIKNLIQPGSLDSGTEVVLVNAIHFKAPWENPFDKNKTKDKWFHVSKDNKIMTKMMEIDGYFDFYHNEVLKAKLIGLYFKSSKTHLYSEYITFKMYVVLPDEIDGLDSVMKGIQNGKTWAGDNLEQTRLSLSLPKFKVESQHELKGPLIKHGLGPLFNGSPDLSGLSDNPLKISKVVQKAAIEINEEGGEAAAATYVGNVGAIGPSRHRDVIRIIADHPFYFAITAETEPQIEVPLFSGCFYHQ